MTSPDPTDTTTPSTTPTSSTTRTALITGASRGLGLALARALARDGWRLILDARGAEALEAARAELAQHTHVSALPGDVADPAHRQALAALARDAGGLDAVINNASILGPSPQPNLLDYPLDVLERVYRTNTIAPLALIQATRDLLRPGARILNVTSDAGVEAYPGWGGYGSAKAALEQLSHVLAAEEPDLRVYWVDPGDMRTQMHQEAFPGEDISDRPLPEESVPGFLALLAGDHPSGRYAAKALAGEQATPAEAEAGTPGARGLRVVLRAEAFERAAALYRDGLGLPVVEEWNNANGRGIVLAAGSATVEVLDTADAAYTDEAETGQRGDVPLRLAFEVADAATAGAALQAHGAEPFRAAGTTPWGHSSQRVQTPDGTLITIYQPADNATDA